MVSLYNSFLDFVQGMNSDKPYKLKVNHNFNAEEILHRYKALTKIIRTIPPFNEPHNETTIVRSVYIIEQFLSWAPDYDYCDEKTGHRITANGFWTIPLMATKLCEFGIANPHLTKHAVPVINIIVEEYPIIKRFREGSTNELHSKSTSLLADLFQVYMNSHEFVTSMSGPLCGYHVCPSERFTRDAYMTVVGINISQNLYECVRVMLSREYRGSLVSKFCPYFDVRYTKSVLGFGDFEPFRSLLPSMASYFRQICSKNFYVTYKSQYAVGINVDGEIRLQKEATVGKRTKPIRVKYLCSGKPREDKVLIFAVHGGGFICQSPETHEFYTRSWVSDLPGVPIISTDYSHAPEHKFPIALNEILDVYLWLTSADNRSEVEDVIGFFPERIAIFGDSAGANSAVALSLMLNDIRNEFGSNVQMPNGIVTAYGCFSARPMFSPSHFMTVCDSFLSPMVLMNIIDAYAPTVLPCSMSEVMHWSTSHKQLHNNAITTLKNAFKWMSPFNRRENNEAWFSCPKDEFTRRIEKFRSIVEHPYISPLTYTKFNSLNDIPLILLTPYFDPLHDDSIEMAKKWRGPLTLYCLDDLSHGFLHFVQFSREAKAASDLALIQIKKVLKLENH